MGSCTRSPPRRLPDDPAAVTQPLLRAAAVARHFGDVEALAPTDVELASGEIVALVGPNGAGKSTLLAILAGALEPSSGSVEAAARVGWVPQRPAHYGRLSARENLELFAKLEGVADPARENRPSADLSVGNRQRLNVALSLLGDPRVLLLDEPTASLDPGQRRRVWEIVGSVCADGGAVCFSTQNLEETEHADRVLVLVDGRVVSSPVDEVFT
jgi:ABC-2 type transport system ATP-binding protein